MLSFKKTLATISAICAISTDAGAKQTSAEEESLKPPTSGSAATIYKDGRSLIQRRDADSNGQLSREELSRVIPDHSSSRSDQILSTAFFETGDNVQNDKRTGTLTPERLLRFTRTIQSFDFKTYPNLVGSLTDAQDRFKELDTDNNKILDRNEVNDLDPLLSEAFPEISTKDGKAGISREDLEKHTKDAVLFVTSTLSSAEMDGMLNQYDRNKDRLVSREELADPTTAPTDQLKPAFLKFFDYFKGKHPSDRGQISGASLYQRPPEAEAAREASTAIQRIKRFLLAERIASGEPVQNERAVQGRLGNCYLIASMNAILDSNPGLLDQSVVRQSGTKATVELPGAPDKQFSVTTPTIAESAIFALSPDRSNIPGIIEKAYGLYLSEVDSQAKQAILPQEYSGMGGQASRALRVLTGRETTTYTCSSGNKDKIIEALQANCEKGKPITPICVYTKPPFLGINLLPSDYERNHIWSIHGYIPGKDGGSVIIRNPKAPQNIGDSRISVSDLVKKFSGLIVVDRE